MDQLNSLFQHLKCCGLREGKAQNNSTEFRNVEAFILQRAVSVEKNG